MLRRARRRGLRVHRRGAADAALGARRRHRDVRRARDHAQPAALRGEDRPGPEHVLVGARDDRPAPGRARRARSRSSSPSSTRAAASAACCARRARTPRPRARSARRSTASGSSRSRLSGLLAGLAGGLYVHLLPLNTEAVYLDLTFITLAMLVVGGATSLWGAVVGALAVSALDSYLAVAENGTSIFGWHIDLPAGTRVIVVGALMALVLILRPSGLTGGREFKLWPRASHDARLRRRRRRDRQPLRRAPRARRRGLGARPPRGARRARCGSTASGSAAAPTSPRSCRRRPHRTSCPSRSS